MESISFCPIKIMRCDAFKIQTDRQGVYRYEHLNMTRAFIFLPHEINKVWWITHTHTHTEQSDMKCIYYMYLNMVMTLDKKSLQYIYIYVFRTWPLGATRHRVDTSSHLRDLQPSINKTEKIKNASTCPQRYATT
jgi:hypothetical protein